MELRSCLSKQHDFEKLQLACMIREQVSPSFTIVQNVPLFTSTSWILVYVLIQLGSLVRNSIWAAKLLISTPVKFY